MKKNVEMKSRDFALILVTLGWIILVVYTLQSLFFQDEVIKIVVRNSYSAAIIDYAPVYLKDPQLFVNSNLLSYLDIIDHVGELKMDMVVFPECGMFLCIVTKREELSAVAVQVPSVEEFAVPCYNPEKYDMVLFDLSRAANRNNIYVVVNLLEKVCNSTNCLNPILYNTDVVFDRNGQIIARYRKYNLLSESWVLGINETTEVEFSTFTTDFDETFGIVMNYDLLFKNPTVTLVQKLGVTSVIYSAAMQTRLPFLAVLPIAAGWSYAMNVNFLASGLPINVSLEGSNIYFGRNDLNSYVINHKQSKIIMAEIPKRASKCADTKENSKLEKYIPTWINESGPFFLSEDIMNSASIKSLYDISPQSSNLTLRKNVYNFSNNGYECDISVMWRNEDFTPNYYFLAYSGNKNFSTPSVNNYVEMCGLVLCSPENLEKCVLPPFLEDSKKITIVSLNIVVLSSHTSSLMIPITLDSDLRPFSPSNFSYNNFLTRTENGEISVAEINLKNPSSKLVTFGIYTLPEKSNP